MRTKKIVVFCVHWTSGLPTQDETLETTVQNLHDQFSCNHDSLRLLTFYFFFCKIIILRRQKTKFNLGSTYMRSFRSSLLSHPLWVTLFLKHTGVQQSSWIPEFCGSHCIVYIVGLPHVIGCKSLSCVRRSIMMRNRAGKCAHGALAKRTSHPGDWNHIFWNIYL